MVVLGLTGCGTLLGFEEPTVLDAGNGGTASVGFGTSTSLQDERSGEISIPVTLSEPLAVDVSVAYAVSGGTADTFDYTLGGQRVSISAGATQGAISLAILADVIEEADETIVLVLSDPIGPAALGIDEHIITISENALPRVGFSLVSSQGTEADQVALTVVLDTPSAAEVTVAYAVSGTATQTADYSLAAGMLTFPPGITSQSITLSPVDDALDEDEETVMLTLVDPVNAIIETQASRTHTILDDDAQPEVHFAIANASTPEAGGTATVVVSLSAPSGRTVTVPFSPGGGPAQFNQDYTLSASPLVFAPGQVSKSIVATINDDNMSEANEYFDINIVNPVNASTALPNSHRHTIIDND